MRLCVGIGERKSRFETKKAGIIKKMCFFVLNLPVYRYNFARIQIVMNKKIDFKPLYFAVLMVIAVTFIRCGKDETNTMNHLPVATFTVTPERGEITTEFIFDASSVYDEEDATGVLQVRWDWDNDGIFDTGFSTEKTVSHRYSSPGLYFPAMQVRDTKGLTDSIKRIVVVVSDLSNKPPNMPIYITPPNWQTWMEPTVIFKWTCSDPDGDDLTFDIYTGLSMQAMKRTKTGINQSTIENGLVVYSDSISGFELKKTYFWQIFARDPAGNYTPGHVWRFTTRPE